MGLGRQCIQILQRNSEDCLSYAEGSREVLYLVVDIEQECICELTGNAEVTPGHKCFTNRNHNANGHGCRESDG